MLPKVGFWTASNVTCENKMSLKGSIIWFKRHTIQSGWFIASPQWLAPTMWSNTWANTPTHRVAITNQRIINIDADKVTFVAKDYRDRAVKKPVTPDGVEFLRHFSMHVLPRHFVKIRRYGIYNPTVKRNLNL